MIKVFICHAAGDREFVEQTILPLIDEAGVQTWYAPADIRAGEDWNKKITEGLNECGWFLVVLSRKAAKSQWVRDELLWAVDNREGHIVPVIREEGYNPDDFPLRLRSLQHIDFRSPTASISEGFRLFWERHRQVEKIARTPPVWVPFPVYLLFDRPKEKRRRHRWLFGLLFFDDYWEYDGEFDIYLDGVKVGKLANGGQLIIETTVGTHTLRAHSIQDSTVIAGEDGYTGHRIEVDSSDYRTEVGTGKNVIYLKYALGHVQDNRPPIFFTRREDAKAAL